jgi:DNA-binding transcriptional LysR family regulator
MTQADEPSWDDLRFFLRAAQAKTLAGAARAMKSEHTTVGRRLSALERSLGAPLMMRGPDGLRLTPLGVAILPHVEQLARSVDAIRALAASEETRVRLAIPSGFSSLFARGIAQLRTLHPTLLLELVSGSRSSDLKKGEADLAIRSGPSEDSELVTRKLCDLGWALYASPLYLERRGAVSNHDDLTGHDVVGFDDALGTVAGAHWLSQRCAGANVVLRSREMTDMLAAGVGGAGLVVLPCMLGDQEPLLERLTPEVVATSKLSLVYRREARVSAHLRVVVRFVTDTLHEHAARIRGVREP